jgi:hypothetical protein
MAWLVFGLNPSQCKKFSQTTFTMAPELTQPCCSVGTGVHSLSIKHLPTFNAEVRTKWIYIATPPVCLHGMNKETLPLLL